MDLKLLGLNIKNSRKNMKLTQAQLAEKTNLSTVHISHIEGGSVKMSVDTLINICNALKTTPNDIFGDSLRQILKILLIIMEIHFPKITDIILIHN